MPDINGNSGILLTDVGSGSYLLWSDGNYAYLLDSPTLKHSEMIAVAESVK